VQFCALLHTDNMVVSSTIFETQEEGGKTLRPSSLLVVQIHARQRRIIKATICQWE